MTIIATAPRALVLALSNWFGAPRLLKALRQAGFHVTTFGFPGLLIQRATAVDEALLTSESASCDELIDSVLNAVERSGADVVIPTDATTILLLHSAALVAEGQPRSPKAMAALARSLGDVRHRAITRSRKLTARLAEEAAVRQPRYGFVFNEAEAVSFATEHGYPVVLKEEESVAGFGVSICKNEVELRAASLKISQNAGSYSAGLLAQTFVEGRTAMRVVVAAQGRVLGGLSAIKLETWPRSTGPSTCVELFEHPEMKRSAEAMIAALGYNGFASFDFMLDASNQAYLIELNPRPTPIAHLGDRFGSCLCRQLHDALSGRPHTPAEPQGLPARVALFPQEWIRDQRSSYLTGQAFHDVPWDEPDLVDAYVAFARSQMHYAAFEAGDVRNNALRSKLDALTAERAP